MIDSENETGNIVTYEDDDNEEYGIEIKGKNVVKLNADKVLVKTPLLTTAQDLAGAINELFQGGSGETPADSDYEKWLSLPEPADNQAVFLVRAVEGYMSCSIYTGLPYDYTEQAEGWSVDWGDGTVETFPNINSSASHTYSEIGEYVVTFTNICGDNTNARVSSQRWIMGKYGDNVYIDRVIGGTENLRMSSQQYLRYLRLPPGTHFGAYFFNGCNCLKKFEFDGVIEQLYEGFFQSCYALDFSKIKFGDITEIPVSCFNYCRGMKKIPLSDCVTVGNQAFANCYSLCDVSLPNCTSIGANAFNSCYGLHAVSAPKCTSIGASAFYYNYVLNTAKFDSCTSAGNYVFSSCSGLVNLTLAADCTFGTNCFQNCYSLYPKPDGSA